MTGERKTYVLVGDNIGDVSWATAQGYIVIKAQQDQTLQEAITAANIQSPADIILNCHGSQDGTFMWHPQRPAEKPGWIYPEESHSYTELFQMLPGGQAEQEKIGVFIADPKDKTHSYTEQFIRSLPRPRTTGTIQTMSCYGGTSIKQLEAVPDGTILIPNISETNCASSAQARYLNTPQNPNPIDQAVGVLYAFHPLEYASYAPRWNEENKKKGWGEIDTDPNHALPHTIGIGGLKEPIDLDAVLAKIVDDHKGFNQTAWHQRNEEVGGKGHTFAAWQRAKARVIKVMAPNPYDWSDDYKLTCKVIDNMENGKAPKGVDERRIALAMTAVYMDETGDWAALVKQALAPQDKATAIAQHMKADVAHASPHPITHAPLADNHTIHPPTRTPFVPTPKNPIRGMLPL